MRKQFTWLSILVAVLALALLVAWPTAAAPSSAVAGTITLDKTWATAVGTTITVTVTDADLNVPLYVGGTKPDGTAPDFGAETVTVPTVAGGIAAGANFSVFLARLPILDRYNSTGGQIPDGIVNRFDIVPVAGIVVTTQGVQASEGQATFRNDTGGTLSGGQTFTVAYAAAGVNNTGTTVKVSSTTNPTGCTLTLTENGPNTGVFTGTLKTAALNNCLAGPPLELIAGNGATITAAYTDASPSATVTAAATVETTGPTISNLLPVSGTATSTTTQTLFADVTDGQSGVVSTTIKFKMWVDANANGLLDNGEVVNPALFQNGTGVATATAITGGFRAQAITAVLGENNYAWTVEAADTAGNTSVLDLDTAVDGNQSVKLKIDTTPPVFNGTAPNQGKTGEYWDAATKTIKGDKTSSLSVQFNEALDGTTVDKGDFTVAGVTPLDAFWIADESTTLTVDEAKYVFLTVPAQAPDAKPAVIVIGTIKDKAGNSMVPNVTATIQDGIKPTLTAALDKTLTKDKVVLTIVSNEALASVPVVAKLEAPFGSAGEPPTVQAGTNQWTWTYTPGLDGSYVVNVSGTDTSTAPNIGTVGVARCTALTAGVCTSNADFATKGIAFERDVVLIAPKVTVGGAELGANPSVYTANPFIVVDFTGEGAEYGIDATNLVILESAVVGTQVVTNTDTRKKATISKATLDLVAITLNADAAQVKFIAATSGLALGEHSLVLNGADEMGNVLATDLTLKFTIKARPSYTIPLVPGMNLMSFPATPEKPALKDAFAGTAADLVVTYDPSALAGPWLIAQKGADGTWSGTLASVDNLHGYWVRSTGTASISINIPDRGFQDLPPSIPVVAGWNLVPVVSITGGAAPNFPQAAGTLIAATAAFSGLPGIPTAAAALPFGYSFDPLTGNWAKLHSGDIASTTTVVEGNVEVGKAYWVYATAKGTITP